MSSRRIVLISIVAWSVFVALAVRTVVVQQTEWWQELVYSIMDFRAELTNQVFLAPFTPVVDNRSGVPIRIVGDEHGSPIPSGTRRRVVLLGAPKPPTVRRVEARDAQSGEAIFCRSYQIERRSEHPEVIVEPGVLDCEVIPAPSSPQASRKPSFRRPPRAVSQPQACLPQR